MSWYTRIFVSGKYSEKKYYIEEYTKVFHVMTSILEEDNLYLIWMKKYLWSMSQFSMVSVSIKAAVNSKLLVLEQNYTIANSTHFDFFWKFFIINFFVLWTLIFIFFILQIFAHLLSYLHTLIRFSLSIRFHCSMKFVL